MALKLALPMPKLPALGGAGAALRAWWSGEAPPEPVETAEPAETPGVDPFLTAAELWGPGRLDAVDPGFFSSLAVSLGASGSCPLVMIGEETGALATHIARETGAKAEVFEADPARKAAIAAHFKADANAKRLALHAWDGSPGSLPKNRAMALIASFVVTGDAAAEALAFGVERILKPGGAGGIVDFVARREDDTLDSCRATPEQRFVSEDTLCHALAAAGLKLRANDDWSPQWLDAFSRGWVAMRRMQEEKQAFLIKLGGVEAARQALEMTLLAKARAAAVRSGKLTVRRFLVSE